MNPETQQLVLYRLYRADEAIHEAELLLAANHINTTVNRLYYACFYAISALLLAKGYSSSRHTGIRSLFHQKVVKPGLISVSSGHLYDRLFDNRQKSDYADLVIFVAEDVRLWLDEAKGFVSSVKALTHREMAEIK